MLSLFLLLHVVNWTEIQCAAGMNLAHSRTLDETSRRNRQLQQEEVDDSNILNPRRKGTTRTLKDLKKTSKHLKSREDDNQKFEKSKIKGAKSRSSAVVVPSIDKVVEEKDEDDDWPFNSEATIKPLETSLVDGSPRQQATGGCQLNENGLYGTIEGGGDVYEVKYNYQTSVVAGTTITQLGNLVIQELDYAITTALLPNFFDCSGTVRRRQLQEGTVSAISANPIDTFIFSGCKCIVPNANQCSGEQTIQHLTTCHHMFLFAFPCSNVCQSRAEFGLLCGSGNKYGRSDRFLQFARN